MREMSIETTAGKGVSLSREAVFKRRQYRQRATACWPYAAAWD
jgi:hypothetical protein